jgi:Pyruvate/2-oxoacid:ferredoxin oxidoreductase delta subunit
MQTYSSLKIYYFSGTGNAKRVAEWISEVAREKSVAIELIDISKIDRKHIQKPSENALIGFCSPTHGFNFPPVMMNFIFRFPRSNQNKVFILNTRAGMRLLKLTIPGLSGIALLLSACVLLLKGYKIVGMRSVDLPSNWISLHPGLNKKGIESLFSIFRNVTIQFANTILEGNRNFRALWELPVDLLLAPVSLLYYCIGRFIFAKSFYASAACNNCGLCIKQCPVKAISLVDKRPYWSYTCESCMHCMNTCRERAIETAHGYIIGMLILLSTVIQSLVYGWLVTFNIYWFAEDAKFGSITRLILNSVITIIAMIISYRIIHYLRRWKVFELLITYTSLTFYKFWGRYKPSPVNKLL